MKIFEFHLNPKLRPHTEMLAFCYEPEKAAERHLGNLCLAGELENILPPNKKLLKNLAELIKNGYYQPRHESSETALQNALKEANGFLSSLVKQGNVSWQGNLHFAAASIAGNSLCFSKTGGIKIIMARSGELLDIGTELETQSRAYSPQTFPSLISGKVELEDKILAVTPDAMQLFEVLGMLPAIAAMPPGKEDGQLRQILKPHQKTLKDYSGLLLLLHIDKIAKLKARPERPEFRSNLPQVFKNLRGTQLKIKMPSLPRVKLQSVLKLRLPRFPSFAPAQNPEFRKSVFLIFALAVVLGVGFSLAQIQRKKAADLAEEQLSAARNAMWQAQQQLILNKEKEANELFKQALSNLKKLEGSPRQKQAAKLAAEVAEKLTALNKIETIAEPELLFSLAELSFEPRNMEFAANALYFLRPETGKIYRWDFAQNKGELLELKNPFHLSTTVGNILVFYEKDGRHIFTIDGQESGLFPLYPEFSPSLLTSFGNNLYFLDAAKGQITKYPLLLNQPSLAPVSWLRAPDVRLRNARAMAIDGSIWIVSDDFKIHRYHGGSWQETLNISIWPELKETAKVRMAQGLPYLYILDPSEKRLVILDKQGNIVKQYTSPKFDNLKDFTVSENGKTIYLLNGQSVYLLSL